MNAHNSLKPKTKPLPGGVLCTFLWISMLIASCAAPVAPGGLALFDPVFATFAPDTIKALKNSVGTVEILPDTESSKAFHSILDAKKPEWVLISPLLGREAQAAALAREELNFIALSSAQLPSPDSLSAIQFKKEDAATLAGTHLAEFLLKLPQENGAPPLSAAIFHGPDAALEQEYFLRAFSAANGPGAPIVETVTTAWDPEAAERLQARDVQGAYLSVNPDMLGRWAAASFSEGTYIVGRADLVPPHPWKRCDTLVSWDLETSVNLVPELLSSQKGTRKAGMWHLVVTRKRT